MQYDKIQEILAGATSGSLDLDQQLWSLHEGHGDPIPYYAQNWFYDARSEERPSARLSTSTDAVLSLLEDKLPEADLEIEVTQDGIKVTITAEEDGQEIVESCSARLPLTRMALVLGRTVAGALHQKDMILQKGFSAEPG